MSEQIDENQRLAALELAQTELSKQINQLTNEIRETKKQQQIC